MEIILAIVVSLAVIFFGALISIGNERQRRAIDALREQTVLWAIQDLRIKRERLAREVRIDDPVAWLNKILGKACNFEARFQVVETFEEPRALVCASIDGGEKLIFSPLSPTAIRRMMGEKRNRLSQYSDRNPLFVLPRNFSVYEISVLNGGLLFDLELPVAWNVLTGQNVDQMERIWVYSPA